MEDLPLSEFLKLPFGRPPPGVIPDFTNTESNGRDLIIIPSIFLSIMILFMLARMYTKLRLIRKVTWDDGGRSSSTRNDQKMLNVLRTGTCLLGFV
jgi:hypothetical protein